MGYLCDDGFIKDDDVRENPVISNVSLSAAAQHMVYSASKVFEFCEQEPTLMFQHLGWNKWMAGFKEAQTNPLIDAGGKKHTQLVMAAMTEVELGWKRRYMLRGEGPDETQRGVAARKSKRNKRLYVG